jgi:hypothetical protein
VRYKITSAIGEHAAHCARGLGGAGSGKHTRGPALIAPHQARAREGSRAMTKEELSRRFSLKEWELLRSKIEFLDVFVAEPFDAERAEAVAHRILNLHSPTHPVSFGACGPEQEAQSHASLDASFLCLAAHSMASPTVFPVRVRLGHGPPLKRGLRSSA